jgi:hypothetical protein
MRLDFNPRISGQFVKHVMSNSNVSSLIEETGLSEKDAHDLIKAALITGFTDFTADINRIINDIKGN